MLKLSTTYQEGKAIGIKVGSIDPNEIASVLGLQKNDIITAIQDQETKDLRNRLDIFDKVSSLKKGEQVVVTITRNSANVILKYTLKQIERPLKATFGSAPSSSPSVAIPTQPQPPEKLFQMNRQQEREVQKRMFDEEHVPPNQEMVLDLRRRLLENMKMRSQNMRVQ